MMSIPNQKNPILNEYPNIKKMIKGCIESASHKLEASLMFPEYDMAAVGTIVRLIEARIHQKRHTATQRCHTTSNKRTPKVSRITTLLVHHSRHIGLAAGTVDLHWKTEVLTTTLGVMYLRGGLIGIWKGGGGGKACGGNCGTAF